MVSNHHSHNIRSISYVSSNIRCTSWNAIREYLPQFRAYLKHKASLLGHENGLPFYDLFAPIGESSRRFTIGKVQKEFLLENFKGFSEDLAEMTKEAYENNYIDFLPRKKEEWGAFCSSLPFIKQSYLNKLLWFIKRRCNGAHKLGHAAIRFTSKTTVVLNQEYSMPVAETASTFNENIVMNTVISEATMCRKVALPVWYKNYNTNHRTSTHVIYSNQRYLKTAKSFMFSKDFRTINVGCAKTWR